MPRVKLTHARNIVSEPSYLQSYLCQVSIFYSKSSHSRIKNCVLKSIHGLLILVPTLLLRHDVGLLLCPDLSLQVSDLLLVVRDLSESHQFLLLYLE